MNAQFGKFKGTRILGVPTSLILMPAQILMLWHNTFFCVLKPSAKRNLCLKSADSELTSCQKQMLILSLWKLDYSYILFEIPIYVRGFSFALIIIVALKIILHLSYNLCSLHWTIPIFQSIINTIYQVLPLLSALGKKNQGWLEKLVQVT